MTPTVAQNPDNINNYLDDVLAIIGNPVHQAMRERMTSKWVYSILRRHPRNRPDLGLEVPGGHGPKIVAPVHGDD